MALPSRNQITPGSLVSIILKADQPTGRQVQGTVQDVLTHDDHPRGVKVLLTDGRVGRVQEVLVSGSASLYTPPQTHTPVPDPQNWQAHTSFPSGHSPSHTPYTPPVPDPQNWQAHTSFPSGHSSSHTPYTPPVPDPQNWQAHTSFPGLRPSSHAQQNPVPDPQNWQAHTSFPSGHSSGYAQQPQYADSRTSHAPILDDTPDLPERERSEQLEYMHTYEDSKPATEDDRNQVLLRQEFPGMDSSLIAAIYGDSKSLSKTREMLEELKD